MLSALENLNNKQDRAYRYQQAQSDERNNQKNLCHACTTKHSMFCCMPEHRLLSGADMWARIQVWWIRTHDQWLEAELALAFAVVLAAVATVSLRFLFESL